MNIRVLITIIVLFFLVPSLRGQDTVKPVIKHKAKVTHSNSQAHVSDTAKLYKKKFVSMPLYARNGYIAITGGLGLPVGAFASNEGASAGGIFSISAAFPGVISHCGIAFKFDYGINGFNQSRLLGIVNNNAGFGNIVCSLPNGSGYCTYQTLLTGLYLTYPHKHITIDVRFLMGAMMASIPSLTVNYYDQTNFTSGNLNENASSATAFAIDFGVEARYPVKPKLSIILSMDYLHAVPTFTKVTTGAALNSDGNIIQGTGQEIATDQPFNIFSFSAGIGYIISAQKPAVR